jgi:hypothetical protein
MEAFLPFTSPEQINNETSADGDTENYMPVANRSAGRDVHIYDANDPTTVLGGLILTNGVTNGNLYSMVEIIFVFDHDYFLRDEGGITVQRDDHPLQPGSYYILTCGRFLL